MHIKSIALSGILLFALAACSTTKAPQASDSAPPIATTEETRCLAEGGTWSRVGLLGNFVCVKPLADAGKACHDKSDCQGVCKAAPGAVPGTQTQGVCSATTHDHFGCYSTVEQGVVQSMLCID
ncbi:MAG: hypothetical protein Q4G39_09505 [Brachymonas sp.]|nr:hypothetical protein [Brachymonas sp.]